MRNTGAVIYRSLRSLSVRKVAALLWVWLTHPLMGVLAFYATLRTYELSIKYFPRTHSTDGVGNAFRHALWCCLIMMYCCKVRSPRKALAFCTQITELHEELFPNDPLQKAMDLHNNEVGMRVFMEMLSGIHRQFFETGFFTEVLVDKTKTARRISSIHEIQDKELVYLAD